MFVVVQLPELVGLEAVSTSPLLSTTTHNDVDGHATTRPRAPEGAVATWVQAESLVGVVDARTLPPVSTATHSELEAQDAPPKKPVIAVASVGATCQAALPPVGFVVVAARKCCPAATQKLPDVQLTSSSAVGL